ncbi:hypothetical protein BH09MYX1_BH09MYX1_61830 [soil metagenome]
MVKALKTGGEVDSWCTKCKLLLTHRIVAMLGPKPVRVECETCHSQHNFRERAPGDKAEPTTKVGGVVRRATGTTRVSSVTRLEQERRDREQSWEKSVNGKSPSDFLKYEPKKSFKQGDLLKHSKFGDGVVTTVLDAGKIEVLFRDEPRKLAHNLP